MSPVQVVAATAVAAASSPENLGCDTSTRRRAVYAKRVLLLLGLTAAAWTLLVLLGSSRADATPAPRPLGPASQSVPDPSGLAHHIGAQITAAVKQTRATVTSQLPRTTLPAKASTPPAKASTPATHRPADAPTAPTGTAANGVVRSVTNTVTTTVSDTSRTVAHATARTPIAPITAQVAGTVATTLGTVQQVVDTTTAPVGSALGQVLPDASPSPVTSGTTAVGIPVVTTLPTSTTALTETTSPGAAPAASHLPAARTVTVDGAGPVTAAQPIDPSHLHRSGAGPQPSGPVAPSAPVGPTAPDGVSVNAPASVAATTASGARVVRPGVLVSAPARDILLPTRGTDDEPGFSPD